MSYARRHPAYAKLLINGCGSLEEASQACAAAFAAGEIHRTYSVAQLSRCQTAGSNCYLPSDVIACLEDYCGEPIFSKKMAEARASAAQVASLMTEAAESTEAAALFQSKVRRAIADGKVTPAEQAELAREAEAMLEQARETIAAVDALGVGA
jgi:hypothetical protein